MFILGGTSSSLVAALGVNFPRLASGLYSITNWNLTVSGIAFFLIVLLIDEIGFFYIWFVFEIFLVGGLVICMFFNRSYVDPLTLEQGEYRKLE